MGWENRSGKRYFYEARRVGAKVVKKYYGSGDAARQAEERAQARATRREQGSAAVQALREALKPVEQLLADLDAAIKLHEHGSLLGAGYHQHSGTWRKRNEQANTDHG